MKLMSNSALWAASGAIPHETPENAVRASFSWGASRQHGIRDARQAHDLRRQAAVGVHEGLEPLRHLAVPAARTAPISVMASRVHLQARGLNVEAHDLVGKILMSCGPWTAMRSSRLLTKYPSTP